ncbi:UDP-glucose 4-epimerase GalE [Rickettsiales bacterium]|nr:UDP-glucose 4-epimerase GalE [Rickettsiales bacterium]
MKKEASILVTGGAGYIGSHICKALKLSGYNPVTYDNLVTGNAHAVKWGPLENGDVLDRDRLIEVIKKYDTKAVIHLAAYIAVGESVENPGKYYKNNVMGGLSLLEAMCKTDMDKIIFSSTAAVYGIPEIVPLTEESKTLPINPYGFSKFAVEHMLQDYKISHDLKSVILRYFNVAGADPESEIGCEHKKPNNLIPILMNVQSQKQDYLQIFGNDYQTEDGTAVRDYIHVSDLADAHILALEYLINDGDNEIFNLGTGKGRSVAEVVDSVKRVTGKDVPIKNAPRRAGDPPILFADASKANNILKWQPKHTDLDSIIKTAWDWQKKIS